MAPPDKYPNPIISAKPPAGAKYWPKVYRVGEGPFDPSDPKNLSWNGWIYVLPDHPLLHTGDSNRVIVVSWKSDGSVTVTFIAIGKVDPATKATIPLMNLDVTIPIKSATIPPEFPKGGYVIIYPSAKPPPGAVPAVPYKPGPVDPIDKNGPPQKAPPGGTPGGTILIPGGGSSTDIEAIMRGIVAPDGPILGGKPGKKPKGPTDSSGPAVKEASGGVIGEGLPPADGRPETGGGGGGGGGGGTGGGSGSNSAFLAKLWTDGKEPGKVTKIIQRGHGLFYNFWDEVKVDAPPPSAAELDALVPKKTPNPADDAGVVYDPISSVVVSRSMRVAEATQGGPRRPRSDDPLEGGPWVNTWGADLSGVRVDPVVDPMPLAHSGSEVSATTGGGGTSALRSSQVGGVGPVLALRPDSGQDGGHGSDDEAVRLVSKYTDIPGGGVGLPGGGADPAAAAPGHVRSS